LKKGFAGEVAALNFQGKTNQVTAEFVTAAWFSIKLDTRQHIFSIVSEFSETSFAPHLSCFIAES
jgi:hypothetical protein